MWPGTPLLLPLQARGRTFSTARRSARRSERRCRSSSRCTTSRSFAQPERFTAGRVSTRARCSCRSLTCGHARARRVRVHEARGRRAPPACREPDRRRLQRRVGTVFTPDGPAVARRLRPRGRDARAAQEPAARIAATGGRRSSCGSSARRAGVTLRRRGTRPLARTAADDELAPPLRGARCLATRRCSRASASRSPRRCSAACPVVTSAGARWRRSRAATPSYVDPRDVESIAAGIDAHLRDATSCARPVSCERGFTWGRPPTRRAASTGRLA